MLSIHVYHYMLTLIVNFSFFKVPLSAAEPESVTQMTFVIEDYEGPEIIGLWNPAHNVPSVENATVIYCWGKLYLILQIEATIQWCNLLEMRPLQFVRLRPLSMNYDKYEFVGGILPSKILRLKLFCCIFQWF